MEQDGKFGGHTNIRDDYPVESLLRAYGMAEAARPPSDRCPHEEAWDRVVEGGAGWSDADIVHFEECIRCQRRLARWHQAGVAAMGDAMTRAMRNWERKLEERAARRQPSRMTDSQIVQGLERLLPGLVTFVRERVMYQPRFRGSAVDFLTATESHVESRRTSVLQMAQVLIGQFQVRHTALAFGMAPPSGSRPVAAQFGSDQWASVQVFNDQAELRIHHGQIAARTLLDVVLLSKPKSKRRRTFAIMHDGGGSLFATARFAASDFPPGTYQLLTIPRTADSLSPREASALMGSYRQAELHGDPSLPSWRAWAQSELASPDAEHFAPSVRKVVRRIAGEAEPGRIGSMGS